MIGIAGSEIGLWGTLSPDQTTWHSLVDHSADVAAVLEALLAQPTIRRRLARLAGQEDLSPTSRARFVALAFLHDVGKANRGFQARREPAAPVFGHIDELAWVLYGEDRKKEPYPNALIERLGFERMAAWFADLGSILVAVFAHHGRPWAAQERSRLSASLESGPGWRSDRGAGRNS